MAKERKSDGQRSRSPAAPSIDLKDAVAKLRILWDKDKGAPATQATIAEHWETTPKSSAFLRWIGSLRQFGLLKGDESSPRSLKPTKLAANLMMLDSTDSGHKVALWQAALSPPIFAKLHKRFPKELPSDSNIGHLLFTEEGFKPDAAKGLIRVYKKTLEYSDLEEYNRAEEDKKTSLPRGFEALFGGFQPPKGADTETPMPPTFKQEVFALDEGEIAIKWPAIISPESLQDVKDWLKILERKISRCVRKSSDELTHDDG